MLLTLSRRKKQDRSWRSWIVEFSKLFHILSVETSRAHQPEVFGSVTRKLRNSSRLRFFLGGLRKNRRDERTTFLRFDVFLTTRRRNVGVKFDNYKLGGALFLVGSLIMVYNIYRTIKGSQPVTQPVGMISAAA